MDKNNAVASIGILALLALTPAVFAVTLDREGKAPPPDFYTCRDIKLGDTGAGGKPFFKIKLEGFCGVHPGGELVGWTPVAWKKVTVQGEYNYDNGTAEEDIWVGPDVAFHSKLVCQKNPWAWGPWSSGCGATTELTNNTSAKVNGPYPVASKYVSGQLALALRKAETAVLTENMLNDWNPYEQTGGAAAMKIVAPGQHEFINPGTDYYNITLAKNPGFQDPARIVMQIERLEKAPAVVGDIALPADKTHWWQPLHASDWPYSVFPFPLPISSGLINGQTGYYKLRVRANTGSQGNKTANIGGWTPWRTFCVGSNADCPITMAQAAAGTEKLVTKAMVKMFYNQRQGNRGVLLKGGFGGKVIKVKPARGSGGDRIMIKPIHK